MSPLLGLLERLRRLNPTVVGGVLLLAIGLLSAVLGLGGPSAASDGGSVVAMLTEGLNLLSRAILRGDATVRQAQDDFNAVAVHVFFEHLTESERAWLGWATRLFFSLFADLRSTSGLATLLVLLVAHPLARRAFDARWPAGRPAAQSRPAER